MQPEDVICCSKRDPLITVLIVLSTHKISTVHVVARNVLLPLLYSYDTRLGFERNF